MTKTSKVIFLFFLLYITNYIKIFYTLCVWRETNLRMRTHQDFLILEIILGNLLEQIRKYFHKGWLASWHHSISSWCLLTDPDSRHMQLKYKERGQARQERKTENKTKHWSIPSRYTDWDKLIEKCFAFVFVLFHL